MVFTGDLGWWDPLGGFLGVLRPLAARDKEGDVGKKYYRCMKCGADEIKQDSSGHWIVCRSCGVTSPAHEWNGDQVALLVRKMMLTLDVGHDPKDAVAVVLDSFDVARKALEASLANLVKEKE